MAETAEEAIGWVTGVIAKAKTASRPRGGFSTSETMAGPDVVDNPGAVTSEETSTPEETGVVEVAKVVWLPRAVPSVVTVVVAPMYFVIVTLVKTVV